MQTYLITTPSHNAAIIVGEDTVLQAAPSLAWAVGKPFIDFREYCQLYGWRVQPVIEPIRPQWMEHGGKKYELRWNGEVLTRITLHENGETKDLRFRDLPEQLRKLI